MAASHRSYKFSTDHAVGIQLTEQQLLLQSKRRQRKPFETQSNRVNDDGSDGIVVKEKQFSVAVENQTKANAVAAPAKPRSTSASTSVARTTEQQRALLRKVLATKTKNHAASSTGVGEDQRSYLRQILSTKREENISSSDKDSQVSSAATSTQHVEDQKALLRKVLQTSNSAVAACSLQRTPNANTTNATRSDSFEKKTSPAKSSLGSVELTSRRGEERNKIPIDATASTAFSSIVSQKYDPQARPTESCLPDTEEYTAFLDVLKREVVGDHTEVWMVVSWAVLM